MLLERELNIVNSLRINRIEYKQLIKFYRNENNTE